MSSDINVQTFSGKVNITSNLLVGSSHLFVDTTNNRVGLVTNNPDAGLHVNSNAYVNTDFRVGSDILMNDVAGRITADSFVGNGSGLTSISSDSGSWVNGTNSNVHLAVSTDNVGIGTATPMTKLDIECNTAQPSIVFSEPSNSRYQTGIGSIHISGQGQRLDFYTGDSGANGTLLTNSPRMSITGTGNVGIGTDNPDSLLHVNGNALINSVYRDTFSFSGSYDSYTYIGRFSTQANGHVEVTSAGNSQFNTNTFDFQRQYNGKPYVSGINSDNYIHHRWFWKAHDNYYYDVWHYIENGGASSGTLTYRIQSHVYSRPSEPSSSGRVEFLYGIYQHNEPGRIDVGIGKRNPASALDVNGVIKQTGANWSLTNGGVQYASNDGTQAGTYAYLNRSLGSHNNVTLTHEYQNQKYTRSRVTVNQTGKYAIYVNGFKQVNTSSTAYSLQLHKNGGFVHVRAYTGPSDPSSSYQNVGSVYTLMDLNANDYVEVYIGNGTFHGNDSIYFAGHLVA